MTTGEVIALARECGLHLGGPPIEPGIERFARLIAERATAAEREACARIVESVDNYANPMTANDCADAIRARSKT